MRIQKIVNLKFRFIQKYFNNKPFRLLDVGAGNHSATRIKSLFPNCEYYGLDIERTYSNNNEDFNKMKDFYQLDLTKLDYSIIPDNYFDGIIMTHVIEHLYNGDKVLPLLLTKLKPGGNLYIEYPGRRSTKLPSMYGSLNFYDDPTHVRIYTIEELRQIFEKNNCGVIRCGTRRNYYYIFAMPIRMITTLITGKRMQGNIFWDLLGFAEFLEVKKN